jgi:hypothetical protein
VPTPFLSQLHRPRARLERARGVTTSLGVPTPPRLSRATIGKQRVVVGDDARTRDDKFSNVAGNSLTAREHPPLTRRRERKMQHEAGFQLAQHDSGLSDALINHAPPPEPADPSCEKASAHPRAHPSASRATSMPAREHQPSGIFTGDPDRVRVARRKSNNGGHGALLSSTCAATPP